MCPKRIGKSIAPAHVPVTCQGGQTRSLGSLSCPDEQRFQRDSSTCAIAGAVTRPHETVASTSGHGQGLSPHEEGTPDFHTALCAEKIEQYPWNQSGGVTTSRANQQSAKCKYKYEYAVHVCPCLHSARALVVRAFAKLQLLDHSVCPARLLCVQRPKRLSSCCLALRLSTRLRRRVDGGSCACSCSCREPLRPSCVSGIAPPAVVSTRAAERSPLLLAAAAASVAGGHGVVHTKTSSTPIRSICA